MAPEVEHNGWGDVRKPVGLANGPPFLSFPGEMVHWAHILAQDTSDLVNTIKANAGGETDLENSCKLLNVAKILADASAKMVEACGVQEDGLQPPSDAIGTVLWREQVASGLGSSSQSKVLHQARDLCNGVGLLLKLWVVAEHHEEAACAQTGGETLGKALWRAAGMVSE